MQNTTNKTQNDICEVNKRPKIITILCALYIFNVLGAIFAPFNDKAWEIGFWYPPYLCFSAVITLTCIYGFWEMKKWSLMLFLTFIVINQLVIKTMGLWTPASLIIPSIVLLIVLPYYKKMT